MWKFQEILPAPRLPFLTPRTKRGSSWERKTKTPTPTRTDGEESVILEDPVRGVGGLGLACPSRAALGKDAEGVTHWLVRMRVSRSTAGQCANCTKETIVLRRMNGCFWPRCPIRELRQFCKDADEVSLGCGLRKPAHAALWDPPARRSVWVQLFLYMCGRITYFDSTFCRLEECIHSQLDLFVPISLIHIKRRREKP